ncbi:MAG: Crp/Fnr family transcriptional regulator [Bacteroidetes bacterium]|nr:Crp/Fnr family transcriptional regulator [Bacteroidota bacterium]
MSISNEVIPEKQIDSCLACGNKSSCFNQLSEQELIMSDNHRVELSFKPGEVIFKQGLFANNVHFIKSGIVKIYMEIPRSGKNLVLNILPPGTLIGLPSVYGNKVYGYTAQAIENTTICVIENSIIKNLIENNGKFAAEIIKTMNHCTNSTFQHFANLMYKQLNGRLADALIYLSEEIYKSPVYKLSLSRADLGELTGMSNMSVVKVLKDFKDNKLIKIEGSMLTIINMPLLKRISEIG